MTLTAPCLASHFVNIMTILNFYKFAESKISNFQMVSIGVDQKNIPKIL